ncbi:transposase [Aliikangiella maris]|uniref:Transposase n=2 Tax=Aliikangiella maris TaxID=3162458 RepID=A0ABV3MP69_9GAMM
MCEKNRPSIKFCLETLKKDVEDFPDDYQWEHAKRFGVSQPTIHDALKRLNKSYKKTLSHPKADETKRTLFQQQLKQYEQAGKPIVYLDESGFSQSAPRTHGYADKGKRCYGIHNWYAKGRVNTIGAIIRNTFVTLSLFTGSINTDVFHARITQDLLPKVPTDAVIVMDNATFS